MWENILDQILEPANRGKVIGITCGLLFGIAAAVFGIGKAIFITLSVLVGYFIGKRVDEQGSFHALLDKLVNRDKYR
ncbi:putative membrane protein [Desulfitispora alkaliphila]|uniref:DUF2273 domain-containing protein n=1 Tax=Desulfitispora alkaliphila TaxID=622674 RepID=UPI003D1C9339